VVGPLEIDRRSHAAEHVGEVIGVRISRRFNDVLDIDQNNLPFLRRSQLRCRCALHLVPPGVITIRRTENPSVETCDSNFSVSVHCIFGDEKSRMAEQKLCHSKNSLHEISR